MTDEREDAKTCAQCKFLWGNKYCIVYDECKPMTKESIACSDYEE